MVQPSKDLRKQKLNLRPLINMTSDLNNLIHRLSRELQHILIESSTNISFRHLDSGEVALWTLTEDPIPLHRPSSALLMIQFKASSHQITSLFGRSLGMLCVLELTRKKLQFSFYFRLFKFLNFFSAFPLQLVFSIEKFILKVLSIDWTTASPNSRQRVSFSKFFGRVSLTWTQLIILEPKMKLEAYIP